MSALEEYARNLRSESDIAGHLPFLRDQVALRHQCRVIELGTRSGVSTSAFLDGAAECGGHVWSVDINDAQVPDHWSDLGTWSFLRADALGGEALRWAPRTCDVLFVDLAHTYEETVQALNLWWPRVAQGGVALFHDTEWPPVNGMPTPVSESEVGRGIARFCDERGITWRNRPGCNGMGVILVPPHGI